MAEIIVKAGTETLDVMLFVANPDGMGWSNGETVAVAAGATQSFEVNASQGLSVKERPAPTATA